MSPPTVIGPRTVEVNSVDKELERIWKTMAPAVGDEAQPVMQASVVNLVVVADTPSEADTSVELLARVMCKAPCRAIVLDSEPDADPPSIEANVSVICDMVGERQICCEHIRIVARGIAADVLPLTAESFYAADLPVLIWWQAALDRPDLADFASSANRIVIDSLGFGRAEMAQAASLVGQSRRMRTAVSDLNWSRLTPYRQLLAQFFDSAESREKLAVIESATIEATEAAGLLMAGWLISRLDRAPYSLRRDQVLVRLADGEGPVFRSIELKCADAEFAVVRTGRDTVEARAKLGGDKMARVARVPLAPIEKLLTDEMGRSGRDRAFDAALRAGVG